MPKPRKEQVSLAATPYYHCVTRCVRRAFLCGSDQNGQSFEHRRQWIEDKILQLSTVFAIDICAYAVMSNHYHVVLHVDADKAKNWSIKEVIERWHSLYKGTSLTHRFISDTETLCDAETEAVYDRAERWRERLMDISWFMRNLNESVARAANQEDNCTGAFWESRFKSQALLDEQALAACLAYVDLNPVRANMASTPEESDHTSIQKRCEKAKTVHSPNHPQQQPNGLYPFAGNPRDNMPAGLPFTLTDYLELVEWTGRIIREDKRGAINRNLPGIIERLNLEPKAFIYYAQHFERQFKSLVGTAFKIQSAASKFGYRRIPQANVQLAT